MRIAMWIAAAVFAGLLFVWAAGSGWAFLLERPGSSSVTVGHGVVRVVREARGAARNPQMIGTWLREGETEWFLRRTVKPFEWWFEVLGDPGGGYKIQVPLWPAVALSLLLFAGLALDGGRQLASGLLAGARWGLTCATALICVAWIASIWWNANRRSRVSDERAGMWCGRVWFHWGVPKDDAAQDEVAETLELTRYTASKMHWWFEHGTLGTMTWWYVPLWAPFLMTGTGAIGLWRARAKRFAEPETCGGCGYVLTGIERGKPCPECGAKA